MLDLGEGLLDWIEVRRIGRQEQEPGSGPLNGPPDGFALMAAEVVHHHDVSMLKNGCQLLLGIGLKARAIDGPIKDARSGEPVHTQRTDEGQRAPTAMRSIGAQALALRPPAAQGSHIGFDPGLIDEHELAWVKACLPRFPAPAAPCDIGAHLLKGEQGFFCNAGLRGAETATPRCEKQRPHARQAAPLEHAA